MQEEAVVEQEEAVVVSTAARVVNRERHGNTLVSATMNCTRDGTAIMV